MQAKPSVQYEQFGAVGDGVTDDLAAICAAHDYANTHQLPVKSKPDAEYYIGPKALTAVIATDTDWTTTRFVIDDRAVENNKLPCFAVRSTEQAIALPLQTLARDQKQVDYQPDQACYVKVTHAGQKRFIRRGLNQNKGSDQTDCFILQSDGTITTPIDWDYDQITTATAWPINDRLLSVTGGIFTTIANQAESVYNYYSRGLDVTRSNTLIAGLTHYVVGEGTQGSPYGGFLRVKGCADVTIQDCFFTGHKIYQTIGSANRPVNMGSYDMNANSAVNLTLRNCRMHHITDRTRWGVIGSNFCKNILVQDCILSRFDAHMGVSGTCTVRSSQLGWQGLNAIGRGVLTLEDVVSHGRSLVNLRPDYGSTWNGPLNITDCTWILPATGQSEFCLLGLNNDGMHDFGYTCHMPASLTITNLQIDDSALGDTEHQVYLFANPCGSQEQLDATPWEERPYPYLLSQTVTCRNVHTASGNPLQISSARALFDDVKIAWQQA